MARQVMVSLEDGFPAVYIMGLTSYFVGQQSWRRRMGISNLMIGSIDNVMMRARRVAGTLALLALVCMSASITARLIIPIAPITDI
jgi:hypothetical protein